MAPPVEPAVEIGHYQRAAPHLVTLSELADSLLADLPQHASGRSARTVMSGTVMRAVVVALRQGAEMAEHDAPSAATLHVLSGEVSVRTSDRETRVRAGQLVPVPPQRHAVVAHVDSAFLLTVALH